MVNEYTVQRQGIIFDVDYHIWLLKDHVASEFVGSRHTSLSRGHAVFSCVVNFLGGTCAKSSCNVSPSHEAVSK